MSKGSEYKRMSFHLAEVFAHTRYVKLKPKRKPKPKPPTGPKADLRFC
jgi:hypothetical protein